MTTATSWHIQPDLQDLVAALANISTQLNASYDDDLAAGQSAIAPMRSALNNVEAAMRNWHEAGGLDTSSRPSFAGCSAGTTNCASSSDL